MNDPDSSPSGCRAEVSRRGFVRNAAAMTAATAISPAAGAADKADAASPESPDLVDTNVTLGRWPFRRTVLDETPALVGKLREGGVTEAWAGHFDALLHRDLTAVNNRLAAECARHGDGLLQPVGTVNPALPGWEDELRRCADVHGMRILRLHPNYHGYTLADPPAARLLELAAEHGLLVQIALIMEEGRTIHPLVKVPPVDPAPLPELVKPFPRLRVQLLNAFRTLRGLQLKALAARGIAFEIAMLEGMEGLARLTGEIPAERICFGSHAPFFYFESAKLKLRESVLGDQQSQAIRAGNARALLA